MSSPAQVPVASCHRPGNGMLFVVAMSFQACGRSPNSRKLSSPHLPPPPLLPCGRGRGRQLDRPVEGVLRKTECNSWRAQVHGSHPSLQAILCWPFCIAEATSPVSCSLWNKSLNTEATNRVAFPVTAEKWLSSCTLLFLCVIHGLF